MKKIEQLIWILMLISILAFLCLTAKADTVRQVTDIESHIGDRVNIIYQVCQFCHKPFGIKHENIQDEIAGKDSHSICGKCNTELLKLEYAYIVRCTECQTFINFKPAPSIDEHLSESSDLCVTCFEKKTKEMDAYVEEQRKTSEDLNGYYYGSRPEEQEVKKEGDDTQL